MIIAAIVAGGTGSRMGADRPKQFLEIQGKTIIERTVQVFLTEPQIDYVIVGVHPDWVEYSKERLLPLSDRVRVVPGGYDRSETLLKILDEGEALGAEDDTIVLSHDGVRPFVTAQTIQDHILKMRTEQAVGTAIPCVDTILFSKGGEYVEATPNRAELYQAQTPQSFRLGTYRKLLAAFSEEERKLVTDVCGVYSRFEIPVALVEGDVRNIKITTPFDLEIAKTILEQ